MLIDLFLYLISLLSFLLGGLAFLLFFVSLSLSRTLSLRSGIGVGGFVFCFRV